jgi:NAD-dependent dihydropyrimidine dehydrogenase PreA subunit
MIETLDQNECNQCGFCLEVCPSDVFRRDPMTGQYHIAYRDDCQTCFNCELECPERAIRVGIDRKPRPQAW